MTAIVLLISSLVFTLVTGQEENWKYTGPEGQSTWGAENPACDGNRQSPISIYEGYTRALINEPLEFKNYGLKPLAMTMLNDGHTVRVDGRWKTGGTPSVTLNGTEYIFNGFHFHWGTQDEMGSEHMVNNKKSAMEMHLVHTAVSGDRLVCGIFIRVSSYEMYIPGMSKVVEGLPKVENSEEKTSIKPIALTEMVPVDKIRRNYYTYPGSLTTPPCTENVQWILGHGESSITNQQISQFRKVKNSEGEPMSGNIRNLQQLNGRTVRHSIP